MMTRLLRWTTTVLVFALLMLPMAVADSVTSRLGPNLRTVGILSIAAAFYLAIAAAYAMLREEHIKGWRLLYAAASIPFFLGAYFNTGWRWVEDQAMRTAAIDRSMEDIKMSDQSTSAADRVIAVARVARDVKIRNANDEYSRIASALGERLDRPLPPESTPWLIVIGCVLLAIAALSETQIVAVLKVRSS